MRRRTSRWLAAGILPLVNVAILGAAQFVRQHVVPGWVKGPLIDPAAPYSPENAIVLFSVATCIMLDVYVISLVWWRTRRAANAWVPIVAMAAAFASAETAMRAWLEVEQVTYFRPHPTLHWQVRPNLTDFPNASGGGTITTNADGMRNVTVSRAKAANEYRILILGDSSNFGHGVENTEVWSYAMEGLLAGKMPGKRIEVLNGACPGWTTFQAVEFLRERGLSYHPDLVIAGFNNDPGPEYFGDKQRIPSRPVRLANTVLFRFETYLLGREVLLSAARLLVPAPSVHYIAREAGERPEYGKIAAAGAATLVPRVPLPEFLNNVATLHAIAKEEGFGFMWINMPINRLLPDLVERYVNYEYRTEVAKMAGEKGFPVIDVDARWLRTREQGLAIPAHVHHPAANGHLRIAEQVGHELVSGGFLPGTNGPGTNGTVEVGGPPASPTEATLRFAWSTMTPLHAYVGTVLEAHPELIAKHDLTLELHPYASGGPQGEDVAKGALDAFFTCEVPAIQMVDSRADVRIVASAGSLGRVAVLTRRGTSATLADLAGKRVGFSQGSTTAMDWEVWGAGLGATAVDLKTDALEPALAAGSVDAIVTWDPWVESILAGAPSAYVVLAEREFRSDLAVSVPWATYEPGRAQRLVELVTDALTVGAADRPRWDAVVAKRSGLPLRVVTAVANRNAILGNRATWADMALALTDLDKTLLSRALTFTRVRDLTYATLVAPELLEGTLHVRRDATGRAPPAKRPAKGSAPGNR